MSLTSSAVVDMCPWLAPVAGIGGLVGGGVIAVRLVRTGWSALSEEQRQTITVEATEVGVELPDEFGGVAPAGA